VRADDEGTPVRVMRIVTASRYGVRPEHVKTIEREGLKRRWPWLDE
jgi:hypothetical protein